MKLDLYPHKNYLFAILAVFFFCLTGLAQAEQNKDQFGVILPPNTQRAQGRIDGVKVDNAGNGIIIINDQPFRVTYATRYYNSYKKRVSLDTFKQQYLDTGFYRNSRILLALWPEKDEEDKSANPSTATSPKPQDQNSLVRDNGVWKN